MNAVGFGHLDVASRGGHAKIIPKIGHRLKVEGSNTKVWAPIYKGLLCCSLLLTSKSRCSSLFRSIHSLQA